MSRFHTVSLLSERADDHIPSCLLLCVVLHTYHFQPCRHRPLRPIDNSGSVGTTNDNDTRFTELSFASFSGWSFKFLRMTQECFMAHSKKADTPSVTHHSEPIINPSVRNLANSQVQIKWLLSSLRCGYP